MSYNSSRRELISNSLCIVSFGLLYVRCKDVEKKTTEDEGPCGSMSDVPAEDIEAREKFHYTDVAADKTKTCDQCNLFLPSKDATCGQCLLFKGPVQAAGSCSYWAPKM